MKDSNGVIQIPGMYDDVEPPTPEEKHSWTSLPFDENVWAELPDGRSGDIEPSLLFFEGLHARTVLLFESLTPEDWTRKLSRSERNVMTIQDILPRLAWHSRHHTAHITELSKRMGW